MSGKILLDTSIIINSARIVRRQKGVNSIKFLGFNPVISSVTITELWCGQSIENPHQLTFLNSYLEGVEIIMPDIEICKLAGELFRKYPNQQDPVDRIIAATAIISDLPLMTLNFNHFNKFEGLKLFEEKELV